MALTRKPVPKDPPEIIAVRERMKPVDFSKVKTTPEFDKEWHLRWINSRDRHYNQMLYKYNYQPVKPGEVETGTIYGDRTNSKVIQHGDLILCKCPRAEYDARKADDRLFSEYQLRGRMEGVAENAARSGIKLEQELTMGEGDKKVEVNVG